MTITEALAGGTARLKARRIASPGLDAALLLAETLSLRREKLIQRGPDPLPDAAGRRFFQLIDRRIAGECTAYILGRKEFRGLDFLVNPAVLVPRPDTETLVEAALDALNGEKTAAVLDLCTGSGAVAIALKHERPEIEAFASDLSPEALETARLNAARLLGTELTSTTPEGTELKPVGTEPSQPRQPKTRPKALSPDVTFIQSSLFDQIPRRFRLITANPPYVQTGELASLPREVRLEPRLALDGGKDGLDLIRPLIAGAPDHLFPGGILLLEADPRQMAHIAALLEGRGFVDIQTRKDLSGTDRVIGGRIPQEAPG
jgi:release factor glutamine methyltransferase